MFREMRRSRQQLPEAEARALLQSCTSGVLAVHGDDGYPYTVPLSFACEGDRLFFHSALTGHKIEALARDPKASFCVIAADDVVPRTFTTHFRSVIAFGRLRVLEDPVDKRHALQCLARRYSPGYLDEADAEIQRAWDRFCAIELTIEHLTGKASVELVRKREPVGRPGQDYPKSGSARGLEER